MARLELRGIQKQFGDVTALVDLSLDIKSGELVSLLGPSGCGKTTALRIIAGFEHPTSGDVLVDGEDITPVPASKRNMGMVFQAYSLFPNMTARQNVEFGMRMHKIKRETSREKADELLDLVGLAARAARYPHELSGGQQQRVALARALAIEPAILLLDEPLSALDAKVRVELRQEIRNLQTRLGITTIYVTHDQEEALSISDRIAVMSVGRLEQQGAPAEVYRNPQTAFVANFVGLMNGFKGQVQAPGVVAVGDAKVLLHTADTKDNAAGANVLVLIRPESIHLDELAAGQAPEDEAFEGTVVMQTFLGSVTRVTLSSPLGTLVSDMPSVQALAMPQGTRVSVRIGHAVCAPWSR